MCCRKYHTIVLILCLISTVLFSQQKTTEENGIELIKSVYFGGGSYFIDEEQMDGIKKFIEEVDNIQNYTIIVAGHTDNIGGKEYNDWLATMRTMAVKSQLLKINIPDDLIHLKKFGMENPLYSNYSNLGRKGNRRVDIILSPIIF